MNLVNVNDRSRKKRTARRPPAACPPAAAAGSHESFFPLKTFVPASHSIGTALPVPPHSTERQNVTPAIMPALYHGTPRADVHAPPLLRSQSVKA